MKIISENKSLFFASILLVFLIISTLVFGIYLGKQLNSTGVVWGSILFSGLILLTTALFHKEGIRDGKQESCF